MFMGHLKTMFHEAAPQAQELDRSQLMENLMSEQSSKIMFSEEPCWRRIGSEGTARFFKVGFMLCETRRPMKWQIH